MTTLIHIDLTDEDQVKLFKKHIKHNEDFIEDQYKQGRTSIVFDYESGNTFAVVENGKLLIVSIEEICVKSIWEVDIESSISR